MIASTDLPTDSVLLRHATTERQRILGLPPTDSVLSRHYAQWLAALQESGQAVASAAREVAKAATPAAPVQAAPVAAPRAAAPTRPAAPAQAVAAQPAAAPSTSGGGLMGWLRRLFGG